MRRSFLPLAAACATAIAALPGTGHLTAPAPQSPSSHTQVVLLGTGTPNADPDRWGPAVAIVVDDEAYLVDAGVGIVRRAAATKLPALAAPKLRRVFITHLHSDHTLGLPDLMFSPWVLERPVPLDVYGPSGIAAMTQHIEEAWSADIEMRLHGGEPQTTRNYQAITHDIHPGRIYVDAKVKIDAIAVQHGSWPEAFGFRFVTSDRTIVISGDTRPTSAISDACNGCDVLVHEVYSAAQLHTRPPAWQTYHAAFHTSTTELAALAQKAQPTLLVLYHQLFWGATDADLEREIKAAGYGGRLISGKDLSVY
jgi:ribonuclease BN (tRNA processing enzyme)